LTGIPVDPVPEKRVWFPAKRYGWGWGLPCAWQGWLVLAAYFLGMFLLSVTAMIFFTGNRMPEGNGWAPHRWKGIDIWTQHSAGRTNVCLHVPVIPTFSPVLGIASWIFLLLLLIAGLIAVCRAKGEKPHWRWGKD